MIQNRTDVESQRNYRQLGFTLIELMISTAIMAITLAAVIRFTVQSHASFRYASALSSHNDLVTEIKMAIDSQTGCTSNLNSITIPGIDADTTGSIDIYGYDDSGNKTKLIASVGKNFDKFIGVTGIALRTKAKLPNDQRLLHLVVHSDKTGDILGPKSNVVELPIMATVDSSDDIVSCYGNYGTGGEVDLEQAICELQTDSKFVYDSVTKKCTDESKCYSGSAYTATCPSNTHAIKCYAKNYTLNGVAPVVARKYADGGEELDGPPDYITKIDDGKTTCTCIYAEEVEVVNGTTQCKACCADN